MCATKGIDPAALRPLDLDELRAALQTDNPPYPGARLLPRELAGTVVPRPSGPAPGHTSRLAAVLVLLYPHRGEVTLLLIRRPQYEGPHGGQVGLPGGSIEPGDATSVAAALREVREEVGLASGNVEIWAKLQPIYIPVSNFMVEPFVAWRPNRPRFRPNPVEVAEVIEAPLAALLDPRSLQEEEWDMGGQTRVVPFFRIGLHKVWGATAVILDQVLWRLEHRSVERGA